MAAPKDKSAVGGYVDPQYQAGSGLPPGSVAVDPVSGGAGHDTARLPKPFEHPAQPAFDPRTVGLVES